jgi:hypothetical protein
VLKTGYSFISNIPHRGQIHVVTLFAQITGVLIIGFIVYWAFKSETNISGEAFNSDRKNDIPSKKKLPSNNVKPDAQSSENSSVINTINLDKNSYSKPQIKKSTISGWKRFFARLFDIWRESFVITFVLSFALSLISSEFNIWWNQEPNAESIFALMCMPLVFIFDAFLYTTFHNTLGKAWLGIKIKNDTGSNLSFLDYLNRNFKVYVFGFGLGLPIIFFFTM